MKNILLIGLLLILFASCKKAIPTSINYGYDYFPTQVGLYKIFDVVDVFHDVALDPQHDTSIYQIKEVIFENLIDNEGDTIQRIKRYYRESDTLDWVIKDIWTQKRTATTAEVVEENDRFIKMVFAIAYDRVWNGNALNNEVALDYYYENIYEPYTIPGFEFESTVQVEKENFTSFIDYRRQYDVYAKDIGRVKSVYKILEIDNFDTLDIQKGPEITYTLVNFGYQ
ncbi:hypothetical protein N8987_00855 [Crocinitomix sp.]|nr:hypothetical protein [Crocinitomix sp.]